MNPLIFSLKNYKVSKTLLSFFIFKIAAINSASHKEDK